MHKEAGGVWSEDIRRAVSERFSIVDAKILVTEVTDDHVAEFNTFCADVGISKAEMNLIGLIIVGCHVKHHELGDPDSPLTVLVSSAPAYEELFSRCGYYETRSTRFLAYISHAQTWATKTLGNITLYPPERLKLFSARLACFYQAIAVDQHTNTHQVSLAQFSPRLNVGLSSCFAFGMHSGLSLRRRWEF